MNPYTKPTKLVDCEQHGPASGSEIFLVEGDSASLAVTRARDARFQAVLPMQGKPMNAFKASKQSVAKNDLLRVVILSLGAGWDESLDLDKSRYSRIVLLFDPDADGIHCGALMTMFFYRWMRPLIESGKLWVVRPPLYEFMSKQYENSIHAFSDEHCRKVREALDSKQIEYTMRRFRGLASLNEKSLVAKCLQPETRRADQLTIEDAESAVTIFGGVRRASPQKTK